MRRTVELVLVSPEGELLGALPPVAASAPWWQEVGEVATPACQVLRLLYADRPAPPGGHVTYLAEWSPGAGSPPAALVPLDAGVDLAPHPLRAPYAEVGGPAASLAWALEAAGAAHARQIRTWNLSAIWRLDDAGERPIAWLKQVPSFFAHEPEAIRLVSSIVPGLVPPLLAAGDAGRMLLGHVEGADRYEAGAELCGRIASAFHPIQVELALDSPPGGDPSLNAIPDGSIDPQRIARLAEPYLDDIKGLGSLVDGLPARLAAVEECGLPVTLVHGDLHPGNVRTDDAGRLTIMDWGDCFLGNPAFDILRLTGWMTDDSEPVLRAWAQRWERDRPGSDPMRAVELLRPVAQLRAAATYAAFIAAIEPSEWPYHADDIPACLTAAVSASIVKE
ncbi:phosphotransferase family protein [Actinoplanes sp. CA-030573]|uniref:phosphotransferase family protein n=1 Tax=Actinoplanes sp. CA-030573 TaxID=3239898 RepID=UPI003D93EF44